MPENAAPPPPLPALTRILIGPPGKVLLPLVALVALIILNGTSLPGGVPFELLLLGLVLTCGTVIVWVARFVVALSRQVGDDWIVWEARSEQAGVLRRGSPAEEPDLRRSEAGPVHGLIPATVRR